MTKQSFSLLSRLGRSGATFLAAVALLLPALHTSAQPPADKLSEIENQLQALVQTVEDLRKSQTNAALKASGASTTNASGLPAKNPNDPIERIREEGLNHSQVMHTLSYLSDVIGQRLTGSPNLKRANEWTRDTLTSWGLTNAQLEPWGPFGRGWSLKKFSAQIVEPQNILLAAYPKAWSPGFDYPITAEVVFLDATNQAGLEKFKGKLKGAIVLTSSVREVRPHFEPLAARQEATNLLRLANANLPVTAPAPGPGRGRGGRRGGAGSSTNGPSARRGGARAGGAAFAQQARILSFAAREGASLLVSPSPLGDGGTIFVAQASVPNSVPATDTTSTNDSTPPTRPSPWATNTTPIPAQIAMAVEDYNRLVRMIQQGEKLKMTVDLQVQFHDQDLMAYNTTAEIPGTDLKDQIVMLGGHMDSWHSGTGATDNGTGVAATMEAVRILQAVKLQPRRTIRIALWTGEEQGLLGSKAYVTQHFGYYTNITNSVSSGPSDSSSGENSSARPAPTSTRKLMRQHEYDSLSAYFNLDNGAGKIRGVYMQGNEMVRPVFRRWLTPFADLGAETLSPSDTGSTDHVSYDAIGLPGFQFIQDNLEYGSRTHHSNADVFDRVPEEDMKQSATIIAAFIYNAAMMDDKLPRKALLSE